MDTHLSGPVGYGLIREWIVELQASARRNGIAGDVVPVRGWLGGAILVACVRKLGGTVRPDKPFYGWILRDHHENFDDIDAIVPELACEGVRIGDFHGVVTINLDGETFAALRTNEPVTSTMTVRTLVLAGSSLESTMRLAARLTAARREIRRADPVMVVGAGRTLFAKRDVAEADLILPEAFKRDLFSFVDGFSRAAEICRRLRVTPSRGALLVGAPGTGKTQVVRHLFSRLPAFRHFVLAVPVEGRSAGADSLLESMLSQVLDFGDPAVVVIEDIDRLFETKALTPQFFLNVLDGLFQPSQPVLWIATSNDPRKLESNLLDRPGRFDRVFVFPLPGPDERRRLFERYAVWPLDAEVVADLARESDGLTGAHLREVCYAAALDAAEEPVRFAEALREQLVKVQTQHRRARSYDFELRGLKVGFGV